MASQSSPRKNAKKDRRGHIDRLLRDGMTTSDPSHALLDAARNLERSGLISALVQEYVLCANSRDRDFPPPIRDCQGKVLIADSLDEGGADVRCPECERIVFPTLEEKCRYRELRTRVHPTGVISFVLAEIAKAGVAVRELVEGVFRCDAGQLGVIICIVDFCQDPKYLTREWASRFPTGYLAVNSIELNTRFIREEWLTILPLGAVTSGEVQLSKWIGEIVEKPSPAMMSNASLPIYSKAVLPVAVQSPLPVSNSRRFVVECGSNVVRIEDEQVVAPQAGMRYDIFQVLWERFLEDLAAGKPPEEYIPISIRGLMDAVGKRQNKYLEDETTVRRTINRLQEDLETAVKKKLGLPIDRHDIVETMPWKGIGEGEYGYRLNPRTVIVMPMQSR